MKKFSEGCLSSCSYIKPQRITLGPWWSWVVYHLVPTSNHNMSITVLSLGRLFIILFLHQTTTVLKLWQTAARLFIILFLHQTTTMSIVHFYLSLLFIILFLHQTTTIQRIPTPAERCLSSCSYIKPQPTGDSSSFGMCCLSSCSYIKPQLADRVQKYSLCCLSSCSYIKPQPIVVNLLVISKILRFGLLRNGRAGRFLLQIY